MDLSCPVSSRSTRTNPSLAQRERKRRLTEPAAVNVAAQTPPQSLPTERVRTDAKHALSFAPIKKIPDPNQQATCQAQGSSMLSAVHVTVHVILFIAMLRISK